MQHYELQKHHSKKNITENAYINTNHTAMKLLLRLHIGVQLTESVFWDVPFLPGV
jgi:hypothetical protein